MNKISFSDNLKNKIRLSPEWDRLYGSAPIASAQPADNSASPANFDNMEDDLPF